MPGDHLKNVSGLCKWFSIGLGLLCLFVIAFSFFVPGQNLEGYIIRKSTKTIPWRIFEPEEIERGIPAAESTNIVFHLPLNMSDVHREVLLGHRGKDVRYWGYCFPQNYESKITDRREGLPGLVFLSEKEQIEREAARQHAAPTITAFRFPTRQELEQQEDPKGAIRHQVETFTAGMMCYLMSEHGLALGLDADDDRLNAQLEREIGTNPETPDSDSDGIWDGTEYLNKTNALLRDTDADGLIDGLEDRNWNGRVDRTETNPRTWDSDRDGLCDGICRVKLGNGQQVFLGEDLNLNGKIDSDETDPLKQDTDGDKKIDYAERLDCMKDPETPGCT